MRCYRCGGLMVPEKFFDGLGDSFWGWRCVMCGEVVDPVIAENRLLGHLSNPCSDYAKMFEEGS